MGPFPSIDAGLNLMWVVLSLGVLLCWNAEWNRESRRALVAILCVLVLLFPAISAADDVAELALMCDGTPSPLSFKNGKEIKHIVVPAPQAAQAAPGPFARFCELIGNGPVTPHATRHTSLLLTSSSGIHSPPRF